MMAYSLAYSQTVVSDLTLSLYISALFVPFHTKAPSVSSCHCLYHICYCDVTKRRMVEILVVELINKLWQIKLQGNALNKMAAWPKI